jgi:hypothetical protein
MRFLVIVKADSDSEAGKMPDPKLLAEMGAFNEEMTRAGVLLAAEGLHQSAKGVRVRFSGSKRVVIDGPFAETKELIAGFWILQVKNLEEAVEWIKRAPNPHPGKDTEIEIRRVVEPEDFADLIPAEELERYRRMEEQGKRNAEKQ